MESDDSSLEGGDGGNKPWQPGGEESGDGDEVLDNEDIPEDKNDHTINSQQYGWIPFRNMIGFEVEEQKR